MNIYENLQIVWTHIFTDMLLFVNIWSTLNIYWFIGIRIHCQQIQTNNYSFTFDYLKYSVRYSMSKTEGYFKLFVPTYWKGLPRKTSLAYYKNSLITDTKSFLLLAPQAFRNLKKASDGMKWRNEARRHKFQLKQIFQKSVKNCCWEKCREVSLKDKALYNWPPCFNLMEQHILDTNAGKQLS